jgi:hypothetical protein
VAAQSGEGRRRRLVAISVVVIGMTMACGLQKGATTGSRPQTPRPAWLIAAIGDRLAVVASGDGKASYLPGQFDDVNSLAVTADGRSILVGPSDCEKHWIQRVDRSTGAREEFVGAAEFPVVNAKGLVAYGIYCDGRGILGTTDITTGQNSRRSPLGESEVGRSLDIESVRPLGWLSDGRTLFYVMTVRGEAHPRYYFGLLWPIVDPFEEVIRRVAAPVDSSDAVPTAVTLVDDATFAVAHDETAGSTVREWDVRNERFTHAERSFTLPDSITTLTTDAIGTHFLAVTRGRVLYRWSVGDRAPTKLADGVRAAAWLP